MANFTLSQEQYEALISLARTGASTPDALRALERFLKDIEKSNGIVRNALWIQWQELDQPLPAGIQFPATWPPEMRFYLELVSRPIAKSDVNNVIKIRASKPTNILVTPDPGGLVGWTPLDTYFVT